MVTRSRGADARVVVGLGLLGIGILLSIASFDAQRPGGPSFVGAGEPSPAFGLFAGVLSVTGIGLLAWWAIGAQARYEVRESREELRAIVREAQTDRPLACAACAAKSPADAKHCIGCGALIA